MISNTLPQSLIDNPILSQWIAFEEQGRVRVGSGKVEIGQGILTALTQIAAEELDVRPEQINLVSGQTDVSPAEGFTSGSYSIAVGGASIRLVCAEVRSLFLDRLAEALRCPVGELSIEDGKFLRAGKDTGRDYWSMAGEIALERRATGTAPVKRPSTYKIVGKHLPRLDLPAKVAGAGFIHDIAPENVLHARVLRQPWRGAHLAALDESAVRKAAKHADRHPARGRVRRLHGRERDRGDARGRSRAHARAWEGGTPPPADVGTPDWLKAQPSRDKITDTGHPGRAPTGRVVEACYSRPFLTYGSIGTSCALAEFKDGALKVWSHSQGPAVLRDWLARALGLAGRAGHRVPPPGRGRLRPQHRRRRRLRRVLHRHAPSGPHRARAMVARGRVRRGADQHRDGDQAPRRARRRQQAGRLAIEIWSPPHAQRPGMNGNSNLLGAEALPNAPPLNALNDVPDERGGGATRNAVAIYDLPRHRLIHHLLPEVPMRTSSLRGLGAWANVFAIESFIDELAETAGEDPVTYRLSLLSDPRARRVVETAARMSGWFEQRNLREGRARGFGFARYKNIASFAAVVVEVEVDEEIRLKHVWCAADAGLVIAPDGAQEPARRRHHPGRELRDARAGAVRGRQGRDAAPGRTIRSCASATFRRSRSS